MSKRIDFNQIDYPGAGMEILVNAAREAINPVIKRSNEFEAKVVISPESVNTDRESAAYKKSGTLNPKEAGKYEFYVRLIGLQPHKFVLEVCEDDPNYSKDKRDQIDTIKRQHCRVITNHPEKPKINDIVKVTLEPDLHYQFNCRRAKTYLGIVRSAAETDFKISNEEQKMSCDSMENLFKKYSGTTLQHPDTRQLGAIYNGKEVLNGRFEAGQLASPRSDLYKASFTARFIPEAIESFEKLAEEYKQEFGEVIWLSDSYRDYDNQARLRDRYGRGAATPGSSNHGWGVAFDVNGTNVDVDGDGKSGTNYDRFNSRVYKWLDNGGAGRHGWVNPPSLRQNGNLPESWHWENTRIRDQYIKQRQPLPNYTIPDGEEEPPNA